MEWKYKSSWSIFLFHSFSEKKIIKEKKKNLWGWQSGLNAETEPQIVFAGSAKDDKKK